MKLKNLIFYPELWINLFLLGSIFLPELPFRGYTLRSPIIGASLISVIVILVAYKTSRLRINFQVVFMFLFSLMIFLSVLWSYGWLGVPYIFGDFAEMLKFLQFVPYALLFGMLDQDRLIKMFRWTTVLAVIIVGIIGILQIISPESYGQIAASLYTSSEMHILGMASEARRVLLTGTDPNVGGAIASILFFCSFVFFRRDRRAGFLAMAILMFGFVLMTQSRTALIGLLLSLVIFELIIYGPTKFLAYIAISGIVMYLLYLLFGEEFGYLSQGYRSAVVGDNESVNIRLVNYEVAFDRFLESPLFGWGPAGQEMSSVVDSEYALILQRYGFLGIALCSSYLYVYTMKSIKAIKAEAKNMKFADPMAACSLYYILFCLVLMTTNNFFSGAQLMAPAILFSATAWKARGSSRKIG